MNGLYFLENPYKINEKDYLASQFVEYWSLIMNDFIDIFLNAIDHIRNFTIHNGTITNLKKNEKGEWVYRYYVNDLVTGLVKPTEIVKKLDRGINHTYEIRMNQANYKFRILFYYNRLSCHSPKDFFVLSYGFVKMDGSEDLTNPLAKSTDAIKEGILLNNTKAENDKWLGGEWNEL